MATLGGLFETGKIENIPVSSVSNFLQHFENSAEIQPKCGQSQIMAGF